MRTEPLETSVEKSKPIKSLEIDSLLNCLVAGQPFQKLAKNLTDSDLTNSSISGLSGSATALLINSIAQETGRPILIVTPNGDDASDLYDDLNFLAETGLVGHFPARQILPYDFRAPVGEIMGQRLSTLNGLISGSTNLVVCPIRALMEPTIALDELKKSSLTFERGSEIELEELTVRLVQLGFRRVSVVEEVGDFAVRGGLIDFFSAGSDAPVRVELFGDEIETIRQFDVSTQRTIGYVDSISILPRREVPITQESLESHLNKLPNEDADYIRDRYLNDPELPGLEWLSVQFGIPKGCLLDYFDESGIVLTLSLGSIQSETETTMKEGENLYQRLNRQLVSLPKPNEYYHTLPELTDRMNRHDRIDRLPFKGGKPGTIDFGCKPHPSLGSRLDLLGDTIKKFRQDRTDFFIAVDSEGHKQRLTDLIAEKSGLDFVPPIKVADLKGGFVCADSGFAILTDHEIFSRYHRRVRRKKFKEGVAISDYSNLNAGDFVVHTDYGIARYLGLKTLNIDNRNRDCLQLQYAGKDRLYVPIEEFNRVSKYSGKDSAPTLTPLGTPTWERLKKKTKKAVTDLAEELLRLYAEREAAPGFAFGEDTVWLKQLEASFVYEETRDQLRAIDEIKKDMAVTKPMDRLICGDVGFGKTEVAIRAAFKAIENGKQVGVLVPTTILAQQHFQTFCERLADFPVRIGVLSRFRTKAQQLETLEELKAGKVELVIGTHRLLSKDVVFKDIGLLIIDEEHRFGVRHKEKLRQLKANIDTISMTATPIPRTLNLSMIGVRDMSLISTSPKDRLPILTEISEFDPGIIATTILREIDRGGQVFFVHNRVQTIEAMHRYLRKIVPQVEIAVAHGQMYEKSLEGIMIGFMEKRFDVLLCTSIIESGLDIPSANTIIINRADRFGLAQLYQIRGRVGRSAKRAYAYLLTPAMKLLKPDAVKRLRAIEAHSDLGSGFALAMRDLEIRGAGTILGTRQSGYIEEIGFDMYNKLLGEAILERKGETVQELPGTKLESDFELLLSEYYIEDSQQKVDIYRRLADARNLDDVEKLRDEVSDRFGKLEQSGENLFDAAAVRISASVLGLEKVTLKNGRANLFFTEDKKLERREVEALRSGTDCHMEFSLVGRVQIFVDMGNVAQDQRLKHLRGMLGKV
ncbi:MAG: transcription-repair coupling factor [bacterium]|nr:transcription-repair coupling factor [bacterium]